LHLCGGTYFLSSCVKLSACVSCGVCTCNMIYGTCSNLLISFCKFALSFNAVAARLAPFFQKNAIYFTISMLNWLYTSDALWLLVT
jgi:hypothetical protein